MREEQIKEVIEDLKILLEKDEILGEDFDEFLKNLKTQTVKEYLSSLRGHSQPEQALKYYFFSINSIFAKYLFKNLYPEVGGESSFVDYVIKDKREEIKLEIKPLFKAEFEKGKSGEIFKKIKKVKFSWDKHKNQIKKYLGRKRGEYVVLTNLEDWYFFSYSFSYSEDCPYFAKVNLFELLKDFEQVDDFWQYLDRQEELSIKEPLDKRFFNSLKTWVNELKKVNFVVDEKKKTELIIKLINKFIFVQTLDNFWVIDKNYIIENWTTIERKWHAKGKFNVIKKFIEEINEFFYDYYDTELFRDEETILDYIEKDKSNIEIFYNTLKLVLGIDYGTSATIWERGVIQYNFRRIDEDILGKAYETFLAEVRKEQGIYYTPKYITQYIVENTVGKIYNELLVKIKENLEKKNFNECKKLIQKFISIKILDPACGSGSFLIKALRLIWNKYNELDRILKNEEKKYRTDLLSQMESKELKEIKELYNILNFKNNRDKISKIIIRHIHGNDLDANALEVAKVNIWLEAIKLAPKEFRYDKLPADTNHILPDLEMNLGNGDSLVGLPEDLTIKILKEKHENELKRLFELRKEYLDDPTKEEAIKEINEIKKKLRKELDEEFKNYLEENNLPLEILEKTKPFHWALDFWFVFFDENLEPKEKDKQGFDAVIGNPPYVDYRSVEPISAHEFFKKIYYSSQVSEKYNLYVIFIEKALYLLSKEGKFGYINPVQWMGSAYGSKLRELIIEKFSIREIDDLSVIGVFDEPTLTNLGLFFFDACKEDKSKIGYKITKSEIINKTINFKQIDTSELVFGRDYVFILDPRDKIRNLLKKLIENKNYLNDIVKLEWGTSKSGYGKKKIKIEDYKRLNLNVRSNFAPIVQTSDIDRHIIIWRGEYIEKNLFSENKIKKFENEKIVFTRRSSVIKCAYDVNKFFLGKVAFTSEFKIKIDPLFLIGVLNSNLMNFFFIKVYETIHPGGNLRLDIPYLKNLPIKIDKFFIDKISKLVQKIITLKKLQHRFRELWKYYSKKFRNNYRSLDEILLDDKRTIQEGNFDKVWISEASVYPDKQSELLEKEFKKFRIVGESDNKLKIYGIEEQREELLLEITTSKKEFRDIIYLELLELMDSRVKKKTLKDILSKSEISVIQPNIREKSGNLLKITKEKFREWLEKENFKIKEENIVKIDNEIQETDNLIDAHVFKLYGLTKEEVEIVLDSLNVVESVKNDILRKFEGLR